MTSTRRLPAELTIYTVTELKEQCQVWISETSSESNVNADNWSLDASDVDQVDAAGVQLLVSLAHTLCQHKKRLRIIQASIPFSDACTALGLADWLATCTPEGVPA